MKTTLRLVLSVLALTLALPSVALEFNYTYEGNTLKYTVLDEEAKTVEVYNGDESPSGALILPSNPKNGDTEYTLTSIGEYAFEDCTGLTSVEIPNSVTSIGGVAFYGCIGLTSVSIPNSVTSIGSFAFSGCTGLTSVEIPNSVTSISNWAFSDCTGLTSIEIPNSVTSIGGVAFSGCSGLTSVEIPNSVTSIGTRAFDGCRGLTSLKIGNSVTSIDYGAFQDCSDLRSVVLPNSVTSIGIDAFSGCSGLKKSAYPSTITSNPFGYRYGTYGEAVQYPAEGAIIEDGVIWGPDKTALYFVPLTCNEFTIPNSVTSIGEKAFYSCSKLTSVVIPNSVISIAHTAFFECSGLIKSAYPSTIHNPFQSVSFGIYGTTIQYPAEGAIIEDGVIWGPDKTALYFVPLTCKEFTIPNSVTSIGSNAFSWCTDLTSVIIPNSVTSIYTNSFAMCSGLIKSAYPSTFKSDPFNQYGISVKYTAKDAVIEDGVIWGPDKTALYFVPYTCKEFTIPNSVTSIGDGAFSGCSDLTSVIIPNSVANIGSESFSGCTGLTSIEIPNSVTSIGDSSFQDCIGLTSVEIPNSVASIGTGAFNGCPLSDIILEAREVPNFSTSFSEFYESALLKVPSGTIPDYIRSPWISFKNISDGSQEVGQVVKYEPLSYRVYENIVDGEVKKETVVVAGDYGSLTTVEIPERIAVDNTRYQVVAIGYNAFKDCKNLETVTFNSRANIESLGDGSFSGCAGLTKFEIPSTVTTIYESAFAGCTGLTTLEIPNSVTLIGASAFSGCTGLTKLEIPNSVTSIGASAFKGCTAISLVEMSNSVEVLSPELFSGCVKLASIKMPTSIIEIGDGAFNGCSALLSIRIPNQVTTIGAYAFQNCSGLPSVTIPNSVTTIGRNAFLKCSGLTSVSIPNSVTSLGEYAFQNCTGLTSLEMSNSLTSISDYAFSKCSGLTSVEIPNSVTSIGQAAFWDCTSLTKVMIPNSVTSIGASAFRDCTGLTSMTIPNSVTSIGENGFLDCSSITSVKIAEGANELEIGTSAFNGVPASSLYLGRNCNGNLPAGSTLKKLTIGNSVDEFDAEFFENCTNLSNVTFGSGLTSIPDGAFNGNLLTGVVIPVNVTVIGENAFSDNKLTKVTMGSKVTSIGENAFNGNDVVTINVAAVNPPEAPVSTFSTYKGSLYVPAGSEDTYYDAWTCWDRFNEYKALVGVEKIVLSSTGIEGNFGDSVKLTASLTPENVTLPYVFWSSSNRDIATVDTDGVVTIVGQQEGDCKITATTLYADSPVAEVEVKLLSTGVFEISVENGFGEFSNADMDRPQDIFSLQGVCLKRDATKADLDALAPGIYIVAGKKLVVK